MSKIKLNVVELDVRPMLRKKIEPFQQIMDTVKTLQDDDQFVLHATFKPTPLFGVLKMKGYVHKAEKIQNDHWIVTFVKRKHKRMLKVDDKAIEVEGGAKNADDTKANGKIKPTGKQLIELDNRGLEPPHPMMRTLAALDRVQPGGEVRIHNDRIPVFLIEELKQLGHTFTVEEQLDGSAKAIIVKH